MLMNGSNNKTMKVETVSVDSVILYFEEEISETVLDKVQSAYKALQNVPDIINLTPSYHSILIQYNIFKYDDNVIRNTIAELIENTVSSSDTPLPKQSIGKTIEIPVDYNQGLDLQRIADLNGLTIDEVIIRHTAQTYRVYAVGFMPGFAYLASVDDAIATPRLDTPRNKVPKGSVAIAQTQTAVYPQESAGGWNIVGHTDFDSFDTFEIGDRVRFIRV